LSIKEISLENFFSAVEGKKKKFVGVSILIHSALRGLIIGED